MTRQEIIDNLYKIRAVLIDGEFCGPGPHGDGDPEVNALDEVLQAYALRGPLPGTE